MGHSSAVADTATDRETRREIAGCIYRSAAHAEPIRDAGSGNLDSGLAKHESPQRGTSELQCPLPELFAEPRARGAVELKQDVRSSDWLMNRVDRRAIFSSIVRCESRLHTQGLPGR